MAEHVFTTLQHTIMDILIPSSDVITDFIFAIKAFSTQNYYIGCLMMFPMLISMVFNFYKWVSTDFDTEKEKRYTWVLVVLCIWPQYQVIKLILTIFGVPPKEFGNRCKIDIEKSFLTSSRSSKQFHNSLHQCAYLPC